MTATMRALTVTCSVDPRVFTAHPDFRVGAFVADGVDRAAVALGAEELRAEFARAASALARAGTTAGSVTKLTAVQQWRRALAASGFAPVPYPAGVESAVRRVLEYGAIASPVRVAALCGAISARRTAPLHGYDVDALPAQTIDIRPARPGTDWFVPLGARPTDMPLLPEVTVYASGNAVLSWFFNHAVSRQACLASGSARAIFFTEAITVDQAPAAAGALADLRQALAARGAQVGVPSFADRVRSQIALAFNDPTD